MPKHLAYAILTGLFASALFIIVFGASLGFVFMFLPSLPLFLLGLSLRAHLLNIAIVTAAVMISLIGGIASGVLFLLFLGLPVGYFAKKSLLYMLPAGEEERLWYPIGLIMMKLALYASLLIAFITWYYAGLPGGLPQLLSQNIHEAFSELEGDYGEVIDQMAGGLSFVMFPITIWLWGILLYGHAWLANRALVTQKKHVRADMSVILFTIPGWMLHLLAICALATLIGSPSMSFLGKTTLLSLMLPYFFLGCALMHKQCKTWSQSSISSRFFLFFVYFLAFTQFWPVLILAGIGLWYQIKGLSEGGGWFKS